MQSNAVRRQLPPSLPRIPFNSDWQRNLAIGLGVTGVLLVGVGILGVLRTRGIISALPLSGRALQIAGFGGGGLCITLAGVLGTISIYRHRGNHQRSEAPPPLSFLDQFKQRVLAAEKPANCEEQAWQAFVDDITHYQTEADLINNMLELHSRLLALSNHSLSTQALRGIYRMIVDKIPGFQIPSSDILQLQPQDDEPPIFVSRALASGYSPTLAGGLASGMLEANGNPLFPLQADGETATILREFIQSETAPLLNGDNVQKVWECAKFLQIQGLSDLCRSYFMENLEITPQNVLDLCYWGEHHEEKELFSRAILYLHSMPEDGVATLGKHPTWGIATHDVVQYIRSEPAHKEAWQAWFLSTPHLLRIFMARIQERPEFAAFVTEVNACLTDRTLAFKWSELHQKLLEACKGRLDTAHLQRLYRFIVSHLHPSQISPSDILELRPNDGTEPFVIFKALAEACHFAPPPSDHPINDDRETLQIVADFIQTGAPPLLNEANIRRVMAYPSQNPRFLLYAICNSWLFSNNRCSIGDILKFWRLAEERHDPDLLQFCLNKIKALPEDQLPTLGHHPVWGQETPQIVRFLREHQVTFLPDGTASVMISTRLRDLSASIYILRTLNISELKGDGLIYIFPLALELMSSCRTLRSLDLHSHPLDAEKTKQLVECLRRNTTLVHLSLNSCCINLEFAKAIAAAAQQHPTLRSLSLAYNDVGPEIAQLFAMYLRGPCTLERLDLSGNKLGPRGAQLLAEGLKDNKTLNTLDLNDNSLGDEGARAIAGLLKVNPALVRLSLARNYIQYDGAVALSYGINTHKTLIALNIAYNQITLNGGMALAIALRDCYKLSELDISNNNLGEGSRNDYLTLLNHLLWNKSLTKLNLSYTFIHGGVFPTIAEHLQRSPELSFLDLSGIDLSFFEIQGDDLYRLLTTCRKITVLRLNNCNFTGSISYFRITDRMGYNFLFKGLASYEHLRELDLGNNRFYHYSALPGLQDVLRTCKRLSFVNLRGCGLLPADTSNLSETLAGNTSVHILT